MQPSHARTVKGEGSSAAVPTPWSTIHPTVAEAAPLAAAVAETPRAPAAPMPVPAAAWGVQHRSGQAARSAPWSGALSNDKTWESGVPGVDLDLDL